MKFSIALSAIGLSMAASTLFATEPKSSDDKSKKEVKKFIDPANMDFSVKPGDDFAQYANGIWVKNNPIPAKETRWGSFYELRDFNINAVKTILNSAAAKTNAPAGSPEKRVGDFYKAAMDSITIEKLGYNPIKADLAKIDALKSTNDIIHAIATLRTQGIASPVFGFYIAQDRKNPQLMVAQLSQGGTTLPDRDYYLKDDARSIKIREAYNQYVQKLFILTGSSAEDAKKHATTVFNLEKSFAAAQMSRLEMRDPYKTYNKFAVTDFSKATPNLNWKDLLAKMKVQGEDTILVSNPKFFKSADSLLTQTAVADLKTYLKWNIIKNAASHLSSDFVKANFEYSRVLSGQKVQTPRWQRMSSLTDGTIGDLLGQLYVQQYFKPEAKARMKELVNNLSVAFEKRIKTLDWMSEETKVKALDKLHAFTPKIGYTDKWETYDGLVIKPDTHFQNVRNAGAWAYQKMISRLGKPVDKTEWGMTPPTVNAYYSPVMNEIVFPAGILQFPFFDPNADDAINYGGIGAVIGHEMSHGFDDSGSQYDKDGALRNWWTADDLVRFKAKSADLVEQFNQYRVLDTIPVNGKLTLGENIGDLGGLNIAYEAFKMTEQGKSNTKIDGFTPDQRFFLAWAQVWRGSSLPETAAQLIIVDTHSPNEYRTIGPLVNMDAWYTAFDVKPGDKLYKAPENRIKIW
ncbi:M13 family metallopeptidase [Pedobacter glucosidilyticus]|uniref:M13 family metallopeptidase n=1 Tax=Pedobacter glucosidilyticus TaxID=1122941 RepID=UPI0026E952D6|nr:M13 family metallopeptidase [Pedobacter glucosidilyticus]